MLTRDRRLSRSLSALLCIAALLCSVAAPALAAPGERPAYSDISADAWFAPYVSLCREEGLMYGADDANFAPYGTVSYAEAVILTARLWHIVLEGEDCPAEDSSPPETPELWYSVACPSEMDTGYGFRYGEAVSFLYDIDGHIMEFLYNCLEKQEREAADVPISRGDFFRLMASQYMPQAIAIRREKAYEESNMSARMLIAAGVVVGTEKGYELDRALNRAEAAALLSRVLHPELRLGANTPPPHTAEELSHVHLAFGSFGKVLTEYHLDLLSGQLRQFFAELGGFERDPKAENEGYQTCISLSAEQVNSFLTGSGLQGALSWGDYYAAPYVFDGTQWWLTFSFKDASQWEVFGSNAVPTDWADFENAFAQLLQESQ